LRPAYFDGRCIGLGVLTAGTVAAGGLVLGASSVTSAGTGLAVGLLFAATSAYLGGFPPWRDEKHGPYAAGLALSFMGLLPLLAGSCCEGRCRRLPSRR
jgi:hypothetical protein